MAGSKSLESTDGSQLLERANRLMKKEGSPGWLLARDSLLQRKTCNEQLREALAYAASLPDYFRPSLVSFCSRSVGGTSQITFPCAASLVLFSKALGIHDDIIDHTKKRYSRLTLYGRFGKDRGLIASDVLFFEGLVLFWKSLKLGVSSIALAAVLRMIENVWFQQAESEFSEVEARSNLDTLPEEIIDKITRRASEFEVVARIGGIIGGGTAKEIEKLGKYGRSIGTASLLRDELIDMLELSVLGHRLRNESVPLPLIRALQNDGARRRVTYLISSRHFKIEDLRMISKFSDDAGGLSFVADKIDSECLKARDMIKGFKEEATLKLFAESMKIQEKEWKSLLDPT